MKNWMMILFVFLSFRLLAENGGNGGGSGAGNGGDFVVNADGQYVLRETYLKNQCLWRNIDELKGDIFQELGKAKAKKLKNFFENNRKKLTRDHWYFSYWLHRELKSLSFCLTGELKILNTEDREQVFKSDGTQKIQGMIRRDRFVFIDSQKFMQLPIDQIPLALYHEALHGLVANDSKERNQTVRGLTLAISDVVTKSQRGMTSQLKNNSIDPMYRLAFESLKATTVEKLILESVGQQTVSMLDLIDVAGLKNLRDFVIAESWHPREKATLEHFKQTWWESAILTIQQMPSHKKQQRYMTEFLQLGGHLKAPQLYENQEFFSRYVLPSVDHFLQAFITTLSKDDPWEVLRIFSQTTAYKEDFDHFRPLYNCQTNLTSELRSFFALIKSLKANDHSDKSLDKEALMGVFRPEERFQEMGLSRIKKEKILLIASRARHCLVNILEGAP
jgi:hypothetical protein